jgi:hypothetical protein
MGEIALSIDKDISFVLIFEVAKIILLKRSKKLMR